MTRSRITRLRYLIGGWVLVAWGIVSYPLPFYPSTATIVVGLLLIAQVQPWAHRLIVIARRRIRPFNRLYLAGLRLAGRRPPRRPASRQARGLDPVDADATALTPVPADGPPDVRPAPATP